MKLVKLLVLVLMVACMCGCQLKQKAVQTPVLNVDTTHSNISSADVRRAILEACNDRGWHIDAKSNSRIDASLSVRGGKHFVAVRIPYSSKSVKIEYKNSSNMDYADGDTPKIHYKYNSWVNKLSQTINTKLTQISNRRHIK